MRLTVNTYLDPVSKSTARDVRNTRIECRRHWHLPVKDLAGVPTEMVPYQS